MTPIIVASTASAFKFTNSVLKAIGEKIEKNELKQLENLEIITKRKIPKNLAKLSEMKILHEEICEKDEMSEKVIKFAEK